MAVAKSALNNGESTDCRSIGMNRIVGLMENCRAVDGPEITSQNWITAHIVSVAAMKYNARR